MKIEVGKKYRTRNGKVGIAKVDPVILGCFAIGNICTVYQDGKNFFDLEDYDVVEEVREDGWSDWITLTDKDFFPYLIKGKDYECSYVDGVFKYRVKDREPEVKEVVNYFHLFLDGISTDKTRDPNDTHKLTIKIIDGVIQPQAIIEAL